MCSIARRALVYALAGPYVHATLVAMARNAGPYAAHATARQLVRDHCEHWRDMLAASQFRTVELETTRLKQLVPDIEERLTEYANAALLGWGSAERPRVAQVDVTLGVVCLLHHAHAAAARGTELTADACVELTDAAMRSVRDIVRWNAAHPPVRASSGP